MPSFITLMFKVEDTTPSDHMSILKQQKTSAEGNGVSEAAVREVSTGGEREGRSVCAADEMCWPVHEVMGRWVPRQPGSSGSGEVLPNPGPLTRVLRLDPLPPLITGAQ